MDRRQGRSVRVKLCIPVNGSLPYLTVASSKSSPDGREIFALIYSSNAQHPHVGDTMRCRVALLSSEDIPSLNETCDNVCYAPRSHHNGTGSEHRRRSLRQWYEMQP